MSEKIFKLEILAPAQRELEEIALLHLELVGPQSALNVTNRIYDSLEQLQTTPNMGVSCADKPLNLPGYRRLICGNYLCIYRLIGESVFVYHIVDGRRDYPKLVNDLK
jgi:Plasmid stabilization system protein